MPPTPSEIVAAAEARLNEGAITQSFDHRTEYHHELRERIRKFDNFQRGDWGVELPDGQWRTIKPVIENRVRTGVEDTARLSSAFPPTIRVEAVNEKGFKRAQTREQVIQYYHQLSKTWSWLGLVYADQIGTGFGVLKVFPDFKQPHEKRFPLFSRVDPRGTLPPVGYTIGSRLHDLITTRHVKLRDLKREYSEQIARLTHGRGNLSDSEDVQVLDYYSDDEIVCVARLAGQNNKSAVILYSAPNRVGRIPVALIPRLTADGKLRGQFDDVLSALTNENRIAYYLAEYIDQAVYAPIATKGMEGRKIEFGPGARIDLPEEGDITRVPPATIDPNVWRFMADMERQSRRGGIQPEARAGDIQGSSIVSGAGLEAQQGQMTTNVRSLQQQMEAALQYLNEVAQEQDRIYCDAEKSIVGYAHGGNFRLTYTPSAAIREGDTSNIVAYGAGAGLDEFNRELIFLRRQQAGWVSARWARENINGLESVAKEENRIMDEALLNAVFAGILAQANAGNLAPATAFQEARKQTENPLELLPQILAATAPQPAPAAGPLGQGPAPGTSVQPPALPGEAEPGQREAALPPLNEILVA